MLVSEPHITNEAGEEDNGCNVSSVFVVLTPQRETSGDDQSHCNTISKMGVKMQRGENKENTYLQYTQIFRVTLFH